MHGRGRQQAARKTFERKSNPKNFLKFIIFILDFSVRIKKLISAKQLGVSMRNFARFGAVTATMAIFVQPALSVAQSAPPDKVSDSTPFVTVSRTKSQQDRPHFCYLKLDVAMKTSQPGDRIGHAPRGRISRFFAGVDYSFTSILKIKAASYEESVILYSRKYRSSRGEGENHDRAITVRGTDYPVFLASRDTNGEVAVSVSADMKSTQTVNLAGTALEAVQLGLKAVSPSGDIVTALTSEASSKIASQIDATAGAFFGATGRNSESLDLDLVKGDTLNVKIFGPRYEINKYSTGYLLGDWDVNLVSPFASYFVQSVECAANAESQAWAQRGKDRNILATALVRNVAEVGTVEAYLRQLDWWTDGVTSMDKKPAKSPEVERFCRRIVDSISNLGLNTVDSYLVADAVARSGLVPKASGDAMLGSDSCDFVKRG